MRKLLVVLFLWPILLPFWIIGACIKVGWGLAVGAALDDAMFGGYDQ